MKGMVSFDSLAIILCACSYLKCYLIAIAFVPPVGSLLSARLGVCVAVGPIF